MKYTLWNGPNRARHIDTQHEFQYRKEEAVKRCVHMYVRMRYECVCFCAPYVWAFKQYGN